MKRKLWMLAMAGIAIAFIASTPPAMAATTLDCGQPCSISTDCGFCTICVSNTGTGAGASALIGRHCEG